MSKNTSIRENPCSNLTLEQQLEQLDALRPIEKTWRKNTLHKANFPAGQYYIGDLDDVMSKEWDEIVDLMFPSTERIRREGELTLSDDRKFFYGCTAYGVHDSYIAVDSYNSDNYVGECAVNSGIIGIIATNDISETDKKQIKFGTVYTFHEPFEVTAHNGLFTFGNIVIDTTLLTQPYEEIDDNYLIERDDYELPAR